MLLFPLPYSSGNLGHMYIKRWTLGFVEWSRKDGFLALVPRERPTLASRLLPCGRACYGVSVPMPESGQSLLSSSLTHLGGNTGSPAPFLSPGWPWETGAFSKHTVGGGAWLHVLLSMPERVGNEGPKREGELPWSRFSLFNSHSQGSGSQLSSSSALPTLA